MPNKAFDILSHHHQLLRTRHYTHETTGLLLVIATDDEESEAAHQETASYFLKLNPPNPLFALFSTSSTILLHGSTKDEMGATISQRSVLAASTIAQPFFAPYACSIGSVQFSDSLSGAEKQQALRRLKVSSGLGHGGWRDYVLAEMLGYNDTKSVTWYAAPGRWHAAVGKEKEVNLEWDGRGIPLGGSIILKDYSHRALALYKPRCAQWSNEGAEKTWTKEEGIGSLGILTENVEKRVLEHMILVCVSIEEQIMGSRGFKGAYHGGWGS
jgi:hypothetical protein